MSTRADTTTAAWAADTEWHRRVATTVDRLGHADFFPALLRALDLQVSALGTIAFLFRRHDVPLIAHHDLRPQDVAANIDSYQAGAYLLSPLYDAHQRDLDGLYHLGEIAPDDFLRSDYHRTYYLGTGLIDEAVSVVRLAPGSHLILSLGRSRQALEAEELQRLRGVQPIVAATVRAHCASRYPEADPAPGAGSLLHRQVTHIFGSFGRHTLTAREREVAVLMLRGYSLKSAAAALGIAFGTIKVHSKNLYTKLDISSQSELFSLFIEVMTRPESLDSEDPLQAYLQSLRA